MEQWIIIFRRDKLQFTKAVKAFARNVASHIFTWAIGGRDGLSRGVLAAKSSQEIIHPRCKGGYARVVGVFMRRGLPYAALAVQA